MMYNIKKTFKLDLRKVLKNNTKRRGKRGRENILNNFEYTIKIVK